MIFINSFRFSSNTFTYLSPTGGGYSQPDGQSLYLQPSFNWLLETGSWDDMGVWKDTSPWID